MMSQEAPQHDKFPRRKFLNRAIDAYTDLPPNKRIGGAVAIEGACGAVIGATVSISENYRNQAGEPTPLESAGRIATAVGIGVAAIGSVIWESETTEKKLAEDRYTQPPRFPRLPFRKNR